MNSLKLRLVLGLIAALVIGPLGAQPAVAGRQMALGVSQGNYWDLSGADAYNTSFGRYPAIWAVWSDWGGYNGSFPTDLMNGIRQRGMVPMVNWQPTDGSNSDCTRWANSNIIRGDYDSYIRQWAIDAKSYNGTVILRFAHELNGYWFIWGNGRCTNTPATLKAMWQHVWNIFHEVGATNVKFLWSIGGPTRSLKKMYPGDAYVDYLGLTAFNWGPPGYRWTTMVATFKSKMRALQRLSRTKPIIGAEVGVADLPTCRTCDKAAYIRTGFPAVFNKWPRLAAIVYFDIDMRPLADRKAGRKDWRLASPSAAMAAYWTIVNDQRFQGVIP